MKKTIALLMALALAISALAATALAEESGGSVDQVTSATAGSDQGAQAGRGGRQQMPGKDGRHGQMPMMPGQDGQNGQTPQVPGQDSQNGQVPQVPGQDSQNSRMPGMGGRNGRQAGGLNGFKGKAGRQDLFAQMLQEGVITQEVYDAITAWMNQRMQQAPQDASASADAPEPPAAPEGAQAEGASPRDQLLKELLESGVITQEQYDVLVGGSQAAPVAPSES